MPAGVLGSAFVAGSFNPTITYQNTVGTTPTVAVTLPAGNRFIISIVFGATNSTARTITLGAGWTVLYNGAPVAAEVGYFQHVIAYSTTSTPATSFTAGGGTPFVWSAHVYGVSGISNNWFARSNGELNGATWPATNAPGVTTSNQSILFYFQCYQQDDAVTPVDNESFPTSLVSPQFSSRTSNGSLWRQRSGYILQPTPGASPTTQWVAGGGDGIIWGWQLSTLAIAV